MNVVPSVVLKIARISKILLCNLLIPFQRNFIFSLSLHHWNSLISHICCGVLLQKQEPKKKEGLFRTYQDEIKRWEVESKKGKSWDQFSKELDERMDKRLDKRSVKPGGGQSLVEKVEAMLPIEKFKKRYPRAYELFWLIKDGFTSLFTDFKDMTLLYIALNRNKRDLPSFDLRELQLLYENFLQMKKLMPLFCLGILPLGNLVVISLAYFRPLQFLSPHFWNDKQKAIFEKQQQAKRVSSLPLIIQFLDVKLLEKPNMESNQKFRDFLTSVQGGHAPFPCELAEFKQFFAEHQDFGLTRVPPSHLDNLLKLHGMKGYFIKLTWLDEWVSYMHLVDECIRKNGGVSILSSEQLRRYCFQRGVNSNSMTEKEMQEFLNQWLDFSKLISSDYKSLLLHAPAIIGYNHKSNETVTDDGSL